MKKLLHNITGWLVKKTKYDLQLPLPIQPIIIEPQSLKRFHSQRIIPYYEWQHAQVNPDCFVRTFRFDMVNELLNEIIIKVEETPDGIKYSTDLLFENI